MPSHPARHRAATVRWLDQLAGADITLHPERVYNANLDGLLEEAAAQLRAQGRRPFIIPTGASDGIGLWGYAAACRELREDFARHLISPRHIVCATGSGGTQGGLNAGVALEGIDAAVWGVAVCDGEAYFQQKVRADLREWQQRYAVPLDVDKLPIRVIADYIGPGYAQADPAVFATINRAARTEGLVFDPVYTGKAFHALLCELEKGRFGQEGDVVFIHTGGMFGIFPQKELFSS
jgi:D-cysteine desulfhydrase